MAELWKDVLGYEGLYQVSNFGNVKSLNYNHTGKQHRMRPQISQGYCQIPLWKNKKCKILKIHVLVWTAFNGPIPSGMQVNHINEDKTDNRLDNLNLMTPKENINWGSGIKRRSVTHNKQIAQFDLDGNLIQIWPSQKSIVDALNISTPAHISECCHGKRPYAHGYVWKLLV